MVIVFKFVRNYYLAQFFNLKLPAVAEKFTRSPHFSSYGTAQTTTAFVLNFCTKVCTSFKILPSFGSENKVRKTMSTE